MGNGEFPTIEDELSIRGFSEGDDGAIRDHRDLAVWQLSVDFTKHIYEATSSFPREEIYGLTSQMRRAAVSISSNIAEGYGRETTAAYVQFLRTAQGSAREAHSLIEVATRLPFLSAQAHKPLEAEAIRKLEDDTRPNPRIGAEIVLMPTCAIAYCPFPIANPQ